ncbi:MAG: hypothetical protein ABL997_10375, partial [Planctomycetota bacterium]
LEDLYSAIQTKLSQVENRCSLLVPHNAGALLSHIRAKATVLSEFYTQEGCLVEVQVSPALLGRLLSEGARYAEPEDLPADAPVRLVTVDDSETDDSEPPAPGPATTDDADRDPQMPHGT